MGKAFCGPSPRVWGLRLNAYYDALDAGPSPRVWGLRGPRRAPGRGARAIPTCVGTTERTLKPLSWAGGPSPRVWGLRPRRARPGGPSTGHPHVCGDYGLALVRASASNGPSPRVWGLRRGHRPPQEKRPGHPHVCGDYKWLIRAGPRQSGPSPRVWGLRWCRAPAFSWRWAIPTCVGTTPTPQTLASPVAGHPHVCGDYQNSRRVAAFTGGPSPRVWGLHHQGPGVPDVQRAIPTCVGTTSPGPPGARGRTGPSPRVWGLRLVPLGG